MEALSPERKTSHPIPAAAFAAERHVPIPVRSTGCGMGKDGDPAGVLALRLQENGLRVPCQLGRVGSLLSIALLILLTAILPTARGQTFEILYSDTPGQNPYAELVQGSDGNLYGTTFSGGTHNYGTVFKVTPPGELITLVSFNGKNGSNPRTALIEGSDGNFYGTTTSPGESSIYSTIFKMTPAGELTTLVSFSGKNGINSRPELTLIEGRDGNFYGTNTGSYSHTSTIFRMTPSGELTTMVSFTSPNGSPRAGLVEGSDGNFYGTTYSGGTSNYGTVFKMTPSGELTTLVSFNGKNGMNPRVQLTEGSDGNFYGTTPTGGMSNYGTVFKVTPAGELTTLVSFNINIGRSPYSRLVEGRDGSFYGTTSAGGASYYGTVFKVTPAGELTTLASFNITNGRSPYAGLVMGRDGNFYGTASLGGAVNFGTVFTVTPAGNLRTIASFTYRDSINPHAGLVEGSDGNFYGTTTGELRGAIRLPAITYKVTPAGALSVLASLNSRGSYAGLIEGSDGSFYGTTSSGGTSGYGRVFKVTPAGVLTTLISFSGANGSHPSAGLVHGSDGDFYGTTSSRGEGGYGTVFKMSPSGEHTTLVSFNSTNGSSPRAGLVEGSDGNFYGTTSYGGASDQGTIYKVTPGGELTTLVSFNSSNGRNPNAGLIEGSDGSFYGATYLGGKSDLGTIFKVTPGGELTTLVSFNSWNGRNPVAGLVKGSDGNFYGATYLGGKSDLGTIFKVTPSGTLTTLYSFDGTVATRPAGTPIFGSDGKLYGTADTMVIWRVSGLMAPSVTTTPPKGLGKTTADLRGTVNANGADTTVTFEYGLTPEYGISIAAIPGIVSGATARPVESTLSGLTPHTTYFYRIIATSSGGTTSSAGASFTTANTQPMAIGDSFTPAANDFGVMTLDVLQNDSEFDGDPLTITSVTQGTFGTVSINAGKLTYTPARGYVGRDAFSYTVSDGFDSATAQVEVRARALVSRILFSKGSEIPGAGTEQSELAEGARFKRFGVPSINSAGGTALTASYLTQSGVSEDAVFVLDPKTSISKLAARLGQTAPGTEGALFSSFKDPLLNEAGDVAFLANLSGGDTTEQNRKGIWISPSSATGSAGAQLVARTGAQPPGAPDGTRWRKFTSVVLSSGSYSSGADADVKNGWLLAFTAWMAPGLGGVDRTNDKGLWIATPGKTVLALREEQILDIGETKKRISSLTALKALPSAYGQGRGVTSPGAVAVQVVFSDDSHALLRVSREGPLSDNILIEELVHSGDPVADSGEAVARISLSSQSGSGESIAWVGALSGKENPAALFYRKLSDIGFSKVLIRQGDAAAGIEGAAFSAFKSVVVNDLADTLFVGKVAGRGISKAGDEGLWWKSGSVENSSFHLLAREGAQPPGVPEGTMWSTFTSVALPEEPYGPLFTARLAVGQHGKAGPGGTTEATDEGLWAMDSSGQLRLVVREGQVVIAEGRETPRILRSFTVLSAVLGSPAQRRSFAGDGQIVYRAFFTDGSQAVVKVQLP